MRWALPLAVLIGLVAALLTWTRLGPAAPPATDVPIVVYLLDNGSFRSGLAARGA